MNTEESSGLEEEDENALLLQEDVRDPINICDNMMMSNYFLKGEEKAFEID